MEAAITHDRHSLISHLRCLLSYGRRRLLLSLHSFPKTIGVACELDDVGLEGEPVQQTAGQTLIAQHLNPLAKGQIGGDDKGDSLVKRGTELEEQLSASWGEGHIAKFVQNDQLMAQGFVQEFGQLMLLLGVLQLVDQMSDGVEADAVVLAAGGNAQCDGQMTFSAAIRIPF